MINARAETVAEKPAFRSAFKRRRCLVPADGYYEWKKIGKQKQPYYIRLRGDEPFAFAGLWERWRDAEDQALDTCTIITTNANSLTRSIHDRMPVILDSADYDIWLEPTEQEKDKLLQLLQPYESGEMVVDPVSQHVNNVRNDDPACIEILKSL
jgi:putative SOS response-associated peptidase YedK